MLSTSISILGLILLSYLPQTYAFYWGLYLPCAQPQLAANAPAVCDSLTTGASCLCADATFLSGSMKDIWKNCGCGVLEASAQTAEQICTSYGASLALTAAQMVSAGDGGVSSCVDPAGLPSAHTNTTNSGAGSSTTGSGSGSNTGGGDSSNTGGGGGGGLSATDQIIIAVVIPVVAIIVSVMAWRCPKVDHKLQPTEKLDPYVSLRPPFLHRGANRGHSRGGGGGAAAAAAAAGQVGPVPMRPVGYVPPANR